MLTIMSHELRSPLHGIIGITDTLKKSATESKQKRQLRIISDCAKRLLDFVSTMMDITAMQTNGSVALNKDSVDLIKLLDDVSHLLLSSNDKYGNALVKKGVRFICSFRRTSLPTLTADEYRITQVLCFSNFSSNF